MQRFTVFVNFIVIISIQVSAAGTLESLREYVHNRLHPEDVEKIEHCGFHDQLQLQQNMHLLEPGLQALAKSLIDQPSRQYSIISPSGHFTIHYDVSGYHSVPVDDVSENGVPDFVDSAAVILDNVWKVEIEQMGFSAPPDSDGNPVENFPIYFTNFGYYGMTWFDLSEEISSLPGVNYPSYIELHHDFAGSGFYTNGLEALKVTAAHEFNHAIQLGYNFRNDDIYFMEMTSTWLEEFIYEEVNDYLQYLDRFIPNIQNKNFNAFDGNSEYANSIYLHMLQKEHGEKVIVDVWDKTRQEPAMEALQDVLKNNSSSFAQSQNTYASWLYYTGSRAMGDTYFSEAELFPEVPLEYGSESAETDLIGLRMRHVLIPVDKDFVYLGNVRAADNAGMFNHLSNGLLKQTGHSFNNAQTFSQAQDNPLILVLTNPTENNLTDIHYSLKLSPVLASPNPVVVNRTSAGVTFYNVPANGKITVFSMNGLHLKTLHSESAEVAPVQWDLRDRTGNQLASGIYLFQVKGDGSSVIGKFAIVRE